MDRVARPQSLPGKAYARAADGLASLAVPLESLIDERRLTEMPGVGEAIADVITKLHRTGTHPSSRSCARKFRLTFQSC